MKPNNPLTRKQFLTVAGVAALSAVSACASPKTTSTPTSSSTPTKRALRIAHLTDFHVMPIENVAQGARNAIRHALAQLDPPDIMINTGDCVMDSLETTKDMAEAQWETFNTVIQEECKIPIYHCIGNHDVWGWGSPTPDKQSDPLYGKGMAVKQLGLTGRFYSFDLSGWHFIVLDSTFQAEVGSQYPYIGKLDDEQFDWLEKDIQAVNEAKPICILSHIPILCACEFFDGDNESSGNWVVPAAWMHIDARRCRQLFLQHPNIRLCLSGHSHQHETLQYLGVQYFTDGAVCGDWWRGSYLDFPPAYVMVDLYEDGSAESTFVPYA
jgi:Icc protein